MISCLSRSLLNVNSLFRENFRPNPLAINSNTHISDWIVTKTIASWREKPYRLFCYFKFDSTPILSHTSGSYLRLMRLALGCWSEHSICYNERAFKFLCWNIPSRNLSLNLISSSFFMVFFWSNSERFLYKLYFLLITPVKALVVEIALLVSLTDFMKVIHVQLNKYGSYLSNKRGVVWVLEIFGKHNFRKVLLADDDKADSIGRPFYCSFVSWILSLFDIYIKEQVGLPEEGRNWARFSFGR